MKHPSPTAELWASLPLDVRRSPYAYQVLEEAADEGLTINEQSRAYIIGRVHEIERSKMEAGEIEEGDGGLSTEAEMVLGALRESVVREVIALKLDLRLDEVKGAINEIRDVLPDVNETQKTLKQKQQRTNLKRFMVLHVRHGGDAAAELVRGSTAGHAAMAYLRSFDPDGDSTAPEVLRKDRIYMQEIDPHGKPVGDPDVFAPVPPRKEWSVRRVEQ